MCVIPRVSEEALSRKNVFVHRRDRPGDLNFRKRPTVGSRSHSAQPKAI